MSKNTTDSLKKKATIIRNFIQENYNLALSQGHALELISKIHGFRDWNTASASLKKNEKQTSSQVQINTVGSLKKALNSFDDSAIIEADYKFKIKEFEFDLLEDAEAEIYQEFSFSLEELDKDIISIKLELVHESIAF